MQLVDIYQYLLLLISGIGAYRMSHKYQFKTYSPNVSTNVESFGGTTLLMLMFTLLIGLRPLDNGMALQWSDSWNYYEYYQIIKGSYFVFDWNVENMIWDNLFNYWASMQLGLNNLFLLSAALYFGCTYLACKKWFPQNLSVAYLVFLGAFSTYSYSFNGVKAGVAGALFLLAIANYENKWYSITLLLLSWGFHHSMQLPVAAYVLSLFYKNPKWYFYGWGFCVLMAILHVGFFASLFARYSDELGAAYLNNTGGDDFGGAGGFRIDFLLYSAVPVFFGYKIILKDKIEVSKTYLTLLNMYLCTNGIWCLCMYVSYCNRIAYLSWFMYPFVLIYPFLEENIEGCSLLRGNSQYSYFSKVIVCHVLFTIFMCLIYYGGIMKLIK